ncbi:hypothetical protein BCV72DRAFT_265745 [Rhizopus microsporus var. microsporus]|uniref:Uncharacterized protein n=1 Tax=Rhizopus microsporus var. microsporus TaxID=86635 RepID=A0A1X0QP63_RHIZD|nr:hypothetical protein BCV72DRAFT_265745 [Rhizopus microsporus var. microsporus]
MSIALISITTDIKNMWSGNTIFKKLLDHLLNVLLKLHLAESRAAEYSEYIKNIKEKSKLTTVATSSNLDDKDKRQRYKRRITQGHDRITYSKSLPKKTVSSDTSDVEASEASNNDEASKKYKDDASKSRLSSLKSVAKHLLLSSCINITRNDIQRELPGATEKELQALILIVQT